jgi:DNA end-binding protein Ku
MLDLAAHIIEKKAGMFDVSRNEDRYENALIDLIKAKQSGRAIEPAATPQPSNDINLMDALRRSVASEKAAAAKLKAGVEETSPKRRAAAAASARDKVRTSPRSKRR